MIVLSYERQNIHDDGWSVESKGKRALLLLPAGKIPAATAEGDSNKKDDAAAGDRETLEILEGREWSW